jgi:hypothetical protein
MAVSPAVKERGIGAFLVVFGAALSYIFIYLPYAAVLVGEDEVSFGFKRTLFGPLFVLLGLIQLVLGERAPALLGRSEPATWKTYVLAVALLGIACLPYFWLRGQFTAHGYS